MIRVNIHAAKTQLSALLAQLEDGGEPVVICRNGKPIAELRAAKGSGVDPLQVHPELKGKILYDPTEPATEEEWPEALR